MLDFVRTHIESSFLGAVICLITIALNPARAIARDEPAASERSIASDAAVATLDRVTCESRPDARQHCAANTSAGVVLINSSGPSACLLGKSWGYDDTGVWVANGCSGEFQVGQAPGAGTTG